ncbi:hypothetical protein V6N11_083365 [Hibiscus sabdariffa]|uniref:Uncharacterized protein n=1 Tax=Hibiscus sabdariffa TaxID=183260 RepID=A0ABR2QLN9_9ROSI
MTPVVPIVPSDVVVSVHVVFVPDVPSEVVAPSVVVPTTTDVAIVEGTNASASGNEGPLDLGVVQIPITGERGKAPLESIDNLDDGNEHKPIREAAKNVAVMMQGLKKNKKNAKKRAKDSMVSGALIDLLKELLGVTFSGVAKDVFQ